MLKKFSELRDKMSPQAQKNADEKTRKMLKDMVDPNKSSDSKNVLMDPNTFDHSEPKNR